MVSASSAVGPAYEAKTGRVALSVFFLSGLLMSLPGAILPAWGHHLTEEFNIAGYYFLAMGVGLLTAARTAPILGRRGDGRILVIAGTSLAMVALVCLALA